MSVSAGETLTFLFTDFQPEAALSGAPEADEPLTPAVSGRRGNLFHTAGGLAEAFATAQQATVAAIDAQQRLLAAGVTHARMALHSGSVQIQEGAISGPVVTRATRLLTAGHGGQILVSSATAELLGDSLPAGVNLQNLGRHRLADLQRAEPIFQLHAPGLPEDFPALRSLDVNSTNLPSQPTLLVGRTRELAEVAALLRRAEVRLVTLVGPGGTGKTRLALQAAADLVGEYQDGVRFVELHAVADPGAVAGAIAGGIGLAEVGGEPLVATLRAYLRDQHLLLVLDNFEQVVEAAPLVRDLLRAAPRLTVLVTSRSPLHLYGEKHYHVPALSVPDPKHLLPPAQVAQYEGVQLFVERGQDALPGFTVTAENAATVAAICARLDGLPLALELAAARLDILPPPALLTRLEHRLKVLTGGGQDRAARQRALRATFDWSHDLLDEGERLLFRRLAAFAGGRSLEAIEAVCNGAGDLPADVLDALGALVDKSLLRQQEGPDGEPRFVLLETIREYACERLEASGEGAACRARHAAYFLALAERAESPLRQAYPRAWLTRLEAEYDNLRAAQEWALGPEADPGRPCAWAAPCSVSGYHRAISARAGSGSKRGWRKPGERPCRCAARPCTRSPNWRARRETWMRPTATRRRTWPWPRPAAIPRTGPRLCTTWACLPGIAAITRRRRPATKSACACAGSRATPAAARPRSAIWRWCAGREATGPRPVACWRKAWSFIGCSAISTAPRFR